VSTCEGGLAKVTFDATLEGSTSLQTISFNMTLVDDGSKEYMAACRVDGDGRTLRILNFNKRKLESSQVNCDFNPPESSNTLTYKEGSVLITDGSTISVQVESGFSVTFERCGATEDPSTIANLKLSFGHHSRNSLKYERILIRNYASNSVN
jgi:hypothetical protein